MKKMWSECPRCDWVEDDPTSIWCPNCSLNDGAVIRMEDREDLENFKPPTVDNEVI